MCLKILFVRVLPPEPGKMRKQLSQDKCAGGLYVCFPRKMLAIDYVFTFLLIRRSLFGTELCSLIFTH